MEYSSPGNPHFLMITLLASLTLVMNFCVPETSGQSHDLRHRRHNRRQVSGRRFYDYDYENSTIVPLPEFMNTKSNVTVREGDMATLPCVVRNLGTKQVAWRRLGGKDNHFLTVGTFTWVRENNIQVDHRLEEGQISHWDLLIKAVQKDDEGSYQCQITDKVPIRTHVYLTVKPRPAAKPTVILSGKEFVDRNEPIRLQCNATGPKIPEDIDWFKDGTKLDTRATKTPNIVITKYMSLEDQAFISDLVIEHTDIENSGMYICRSSDREIASLKVTVLVADTTNVKRGTGAHKEEQQFGSAVKMENSSPSPTLFSSLIVLLLAVVL